jgi:hypothetical protein
MVGWRKSTHSDGNGGECVELASAAGTILVRDTADRGGATLTVTAQAWRNLLTRLRLGAPRVPRPPSGRRSTAAQAHVMGVSRPVGRVLCPRLRGATVIHLGLPLPTASCGLPASIGRAALKHSRRPTA